MAPTPPRKIAAGEAPANRPAVASSVSGYAAGIPAPQIRQRPRRTSHETTGTLSRARITAPHDGHIDRPLVTCSRLGARWMRTVRKDPMKSPAKANASARITVLSSDVERHRLSLLAARFVAGYPGPGRAFSPVRPSARPR